MELPAAEGTVSYPMTLDSPFGSTTLTERPDRIAVISPSTVDTDALVALGVTPVMAADTVELEPWIPKKTIEGSRPSGPPRRVRFPGPRRCWRPSLT